MAQPNPKIVPFKPGGQSSYRGNQDAMKGLVTSECRSIYSEHLAKLHHEFFNKIDDELFTLSDKAENSSLQSIYFEAMRFIRKERGEIEKKFIGIVLKQFDDFWDNRIAFAADQPIAELDEDSFSLIDNEVLEENLAISTMIDKISKLLHTELYGLNKRFAALLGQEEIDHELNPVGPHQICHGFEQVIKPLILDLKIKLVIYKLYEKFVSPRLDIVYKEINSALIKADILPKLTRSVRRSGMNASAQPVLGQSVDSDFPQSNTDPYSGGLGGTPEIDSAAELQVFQEFQSLLGGWRVRNGFSSPNNSSIVGHNSLPTYQTSDVLKMLSVLQANQEEPIGQPAHGLKLYVTDQLRSVAPDNQDRPLADLEEDIIDMVGMVFDFILDDDNLPDAVKLLIGRLQIPVVKVAILEKGFFSRKSHPVRELLNKLAKAGSNFDESSSTNSHLLAEIESIVEAVLTKFDHNVELFSVLLERFNAFLDKDQQRSLVIEDRTRQVIESKEQLELAKSKVGFIVIRCIQGKELPVVVRSFLNDAWKHVMLLAYLRKDKSFSEWEGTLAVVTRLIWTVTPPEDMEEKKKILQEIPRLIKDIRIGLENISFDPHKMTAFFKDLEACHMHALNAVGSNTEIPAEAEKMNSAVSCKAPGKQIDKSVADSELAAEIDQLSAGMSQLDEALFNDLDKGMARAGSSTETIEEIILATSGQEQQVDQVEDEFTGQVGNIEVGQWLSFRDENDEEIKAKLSWKSQVTSLYVFVDAKGAKVAEKSLHGLAAEMRRGSVTLIQNNKIPVMDRALSAMMKSLKNVDEESPVCV